MASSSSSAVLADLGRSSYVSQRGLADTLRRLQSTGKLSKEETVSRSSIKRAREFEMESHATRFGKICIDKELTGVSGSTLNVTLVNPVSLLVYLLENNMALQQIFVERLRLHPCDYGSKWRLIVYCDEVVLGNALRHQNNRKLQVFYFSFLEVGQGLLSKEDLWIPLAVIRSNKVTELGGVTVVWPQILDPGLLYLHILLS